MKISCTRPTVLTQQGAEGGQGGGLPQLHRCGGTLRQRHVSHIVEHSHIVGAGLQQRPPSRGGIGRALQPRADCLTRWL